MYLRVFPIRLVFTGRRTADRCDTCSSFMWATYAFPTGPLVKVNSTASKADSGRVLVCFSQPSLYPNSELRLCRLLSEGTFFVSRKPESEIPDSNLSVFLNRFSIRIQSPGSFLLSLSVDMSFIVKNLGLNSI